MKLLSRTDISNVAPSSEYSDSPEHNYFHSVGERSVGGPWWRDEAPERWMPQGFVTGFVYEDQGVSR